jgi:hypothetical protein
LISGFRRVTSISGYLQLQVENAKKKNEYM